MKKTSGIVGETGIVLLNCFSGVFVTEIKFDHHTLEVFDFFDNFHMYCISFLSPIPLQLFPHHLTVPQCLSSSYMSKNLYNLLSSFSGALCTCVGLTS